MKTVAATQFKAHCLELIDEVLRTGEEVLVTKHGRPTARICPPVSRAALPWEPGRCKETLVSAGDLLAPVEDDDAYDLESTWFSTPTSGSGG